MAEGEFGEKTEDPTEHRRREERRKGNVAHSSELSIAGHLVATAVVLLLLGRSFVEALGRMMASHLMAAGDRSGDQGSILTLFRDVGVWASVNVLPWLAVLFLSAVAVNLAQVGFVLATNKLRPDPNAINPMTGLKRIFSIRTPVTLAISLGKLSLLGAAAVWLVWSEMPLFVSLSGQDVLTTFVVIGQSIVKLALLLAAILSLMGIADFAFQKWKYEQDIRMTKEELKRELKDMEGDPLIRRRRREAHQKLAQARDVETVSAATFILTTPTHEAVAFRYELPDCPIPTVVARGTDEVATRMLEVAAEGGIPIIERPELARELYRTLDVGQGIPAKLYDVFIEILKYVYTITGRTIDLSASSAAK
jgi:flagellar biosynthetic protein FlhB